MNRVERRLRELINPHSTAFAMWWCHSARYWRLPWMTTGTQASARREGASGAYFARPRVRDVFRARCLLASSAGAKPRQVAAGSMIGAADREATRPQGAPLTRQLRAGQSVAEEAGSGQHPVRARKPG